MQNKLKTFTESKQFQIFFMGIILLSGLVVGLDSYPEISGKYGEILQFLDSFILWLFVFEIAVKMFSLRNKFLEIFKDGWNTFDFIIVLNKIIDLFYPLVL